MTVVYSEQVDRESPFPGSTRRILFVDEKAMVSLFEASPGSRVAAHRHSNVQMGFRAKQNTSRLARPRSLNLVHSNFLAMRNTK